MLYHMLLLPHMVFWKICKDLRSIPYGLWYFANVFTCGQSSWRIQSWMCFKKLKWWKVWLMFSKLNEISPQQRFHPNDQQNSPNNFEMCTQLNHLSMKTTNFKRTTAVLISILFCSPCRCSLFRSRWRRCIGDDAETNAVALGSGSRIPVTMSITR